MKICKKCKINNWAILKKEKQKESGTLYFVMVGYVFQCKKCLRKIKGSMAKIYGEGEV